MCVHYRTNYYGVDGKHYQVQQSSNN